MRREEDGSIIGTGSGVERGWGMKEKRANAGRWHEERRWEM
jgi:hypothetical protein